MTTPSRQAALDKSRAVLQPYMRHTVRRLVNRNDAVTEALCDIAMGDKLHWEYKEWEAVLAQLDACNDKLEDWLAIR